LLESQRRINSQNKVGWGGSSGKGKPRIKKEPEGEKASDPVYSQGEEDPSEGGKGPEKKGETYRPPKCCLIGCGGGVKAACLGNRERSNRCRGGGSMKLFQGNTKKEGRKKKDGELCLKAGSQPEKGKAEILRALFHTQPGKEVTGGGPPSQRANRRGRM